jgi:hypothetical protein
LSPARRIRGRFPGDTARIAMFQRSLVVCSARNLRISMLVFCSATLTPRVASVDSTLNRTGLPA